MAASTPHAVGSASRRRRRPRRGSLARPVNGSLYRASFLVVVIPVLLLALTVSKPPPLAKPALPGSFDTQAAVELATDLSNTYADRAPGTAGAIGAASWFTDQLPTQVYGLQTRTTAWKQNVPGLGEVQLENIVAIAPGQSSGSVIVVTAHRDDLGTGPGANDNASGTAALIELARSYAQPQTPSAPVVSPRTIVFLSTDAGDYGGLGAIHFLEHSPYRHKIAAVVNLDAIAGTGHPVLQIAGDKPRSPNASLVATAVARIAEQTGAAPHHVGFFGQLFDLAFPLTLYEQGPFVAAGIPAITLTTGGDRPPAAFGDDATHLDRTRLGQLGASAQQLIGSLDLGVALAPSTQSYVWLGGRVVRGWAIELVLISLLVPFAVAVIDLYALCRRNRVPLVPAARALRSRLLFWLFVGLVFTCFRSFGAWPSGPARPPNPATQLAGHWPVLALIALVGILVLGWLVERQRLVIRRPITAEEEVAGYTVGLVALLVVALLVTAVNAFALLFVLPALHIWLWLPQIRIARAPVRLGLFLLGLVGPLLLVAEVGWRFGLGFDAPWYLLELVGVGYVGLAGFAIVLASGAAACQIGTAAAGRYAPYPDASERGPRGPLREAVRSVVLAFRDRRTVDAPAVYKLR
jgi:aminopeptidase YwaD